MVALKAFGLWLLILGLAIANGGLREAVLVGALHHPAAFTVSGLILITCVLGAAVLFIPWLGSLRPRGYALVGVFWLVLTVAFEFGFGVLARGQTLASLFEAYEFKEGNIWPLVLLAVAVAPLAAARVRRLV